MTTDRARALIGRMVVFGDTIGERVGLMFLTYYGAQPLAHVSCSKRDSTIRVFLTRILTAARIEPFRGVMQKPPWSTSANLCVFYQNPYRPPRKGHLRTSRSAEGRSGSTERSGLCVKQLVS